LGLRGEVLFPLVAVVGVLGCERRLWRARRFWAGCVLVLMAIAFVSSVRLTGVAASHGAGFSPFAALEEMGHSVRPLTASVKWHEHAREPYLHGSTYVAPIDRQVRALAGSPIPAARNDYRLMNVEISRRLGPVGGSVIAEAHHNSGLPGVVAVMTVVGGLAGVLFRHPRSPIRIALSGVVAVLLMMHIRNSFAPLPIWGALGCLSIVAGLVVGKAHLSSGAKPPRPMRKRSRRTASLQPKSVLSES
jgi:hypothetical protein